MLLFFVVVVVAVVVIVVVVDVVVVSNVVVVDVVDAVCDMSVFLVVSRKYRSFHAVLDSIHLMQRRC